MICQQCHLRPISRRKRDSIFCNLCIKMLDKPLQQPPSEDAKDYWLRRFEKEASGVLQ